jgi:hypothetical protein
MRGTNAIASIFPTSIESKPEQKGQRNVHLDRRDDAIATRFYFYHHIKRLRYDDILLKLEREFFLTPNVIIQRLNERTAFMKDLAQKAPKRDALKKMLPFYGWY